MSNEISVSVSLACTKLTSETAAVARQQLSLLRNMVGNFNVLSCIQMIASKVVASNGQTIPLGGVSPSTAASSGSQAGSPHLAWFANLGSGAAADVIRIGDANQSSAIIAELQVGDISLVPLYGNCLPIAWGVAGTSASNNQCILEYFINGY